jgi:hypothetical protein
MQSRGTMNSEHDRHDRVLVARYAAGEAYHSEIDEAKDLVDNCDECAALAADIRLISARTADLPAARRPRDFRITPEQAEQLRGSWFDRLMRGFSSPGWSVVRPVAAASLAIGMVLIVVGALPISLGGGSSAEPVAGNQDHSGYTYRGATALASFAAAEVPPVAAASAPSSKGVGITTPQQVPAPSGAAALGGGSASTFGAVDSVASATASMAASTTQPNPEYNAPGPSTAPPPPMAATAAPVATASTGEVAPAPSTHSPGDLSGASQGQAQVGVVDESSFDRSTLVVIGMVVAFFALIALGLVWVARRRYSDPLVR